MPRMVSWVYVDNTGYGENINCKNTIGINGPVDNRYSQCVVEDCTVAYKITSSALVWDCTASWTDPNCASQTAIQTGSIRLSLSGVRANFTEGGSAPKNFLAGVAQGESPKTIEACIFDPSKLSENSNKIYGGYLKTDVIVPIS